MSENAGRERHPLAPIFDPESIAVVGASANTAKRGNQILRALGEAGFKGPVFPVHPTEGTILGRRVFPSIAALPEPVDLAVICTRGETAADLIRECAGRGIPGAVVLAVGMSEPSHPFGGELEEELEAAVAESGVRVVGPNTSGIANLRSGANVIGATGIRPGDLALVAQSGNVVLSLMKEATERSWSGISSCIGLGNQIDVDLADAVDYLGADEDTKGVIAYVEGLPDPPAFLTRLAEVTRSKPVVMVIGGRSEKGKSAALSHTGSLAGPYDRLAAGLRQAGATVLERSDELLSIAETLAHQPIPAAGTGIAVLSDGGGQGTLAIDTLVESGAPLVRLSQDTRDRLTELLGHTASVRNPVDLAGAADLDPVVFARALEVICDDESVGSVLLVGLFGGYSIRFSDSLAEAELEAARRMADAAQRTGRAVVVHTMYADARSDPLETLGSRGIPVIASLETACASVHALHRRRAVLDRPAWQPTMERPARRELDDPLGAISEWDARQLLEEGGITFPPGELVVSGADAGAAAERFGRRVALKVSHPSIVHKALLKCVELDVSPEDAAAAFERLQANALPFARTEADPDPELPILVTAMAERGPVELIVGIVREAGLGPVLTVGSGGSRVEVDRDVAHRVLPVDAEEIRSALLETRAGRAIADARSKEPDAMDAVIEVAQKMADLVLSRPDLREVEINPLFVYDDGIVPIDAWACLD